MIPAGLITYSASQIECLAANAIRRRPDVECVAPPINIEKLIHNMPDIDIDYRPELKARHRCEGCVCKEPFGKMRWVVIDDTMLAGPWADFNAVLAEEFAHIMIHPALFDFVKCPDDFVELQLDPQWARYEADARRYSLAIRVPDCLVVGEVEHAYASAVNEWGFGDSEIIETMVVNRMAERFRVSPEDAGRRITNYPCDLRDRLRNSIQARELSLMPENWVVRARIPRSQGSLFRKN